MNLSGAGKRPLAVNSHHRLPGRAAGRRVACASSMLTGQPPAPAADTVASGVLPWLADELAVPGVASLIAGRVVAGFTQAPKTADLWPP